MNYFIWTISIEQVEVRNEKWMFWFFVMVV